MPFRFAKSPIDTAAARRDLLDAAAGGYVSFEGWVRDHNEGLAVSHLEYEAFEALAIKEAERVLAEALERFPIRKAACIHRVGDLAIGDLAVWVGVSAAHRGEAFDACRYVIDEIKHRLPIWKKEYYANGDSGWINCERCGSAPSHAAAHGLAHVAGTGDAQAHAHDHAPDRSNAHAHDRPRDPVA